MSVGKKPGKEEFYTEEVLLLRRIKRAAVSALISPSLSNNKDLTELLAEYRNEWEIKHGRY